MVYRGEHKIKLKLICFQLLQLSPFTTLVNLLFYCFSLAKYYIDVAFFLFRSCNLANVVSRPRKWYKISHAEHLVAQRSIQN